MQFSAPLLIIRLSRMLLLVIKGYEERRDSFVKTALFVLRVSGKTHAINKCYENSRP